MNSVHSMSLANQSADGRTVLVRQLNDQLRQAGEGGTTVLTAGVAALPRATLDGVLAAVADYNRFDAANDPFGEHDFGALRVDGRLLCFTIAAQDRTLIEHWPDPANLALTRRVLTVILAAEF